MSINGIGQGYYGNYYGTSNISALYHSRLQEAMQKINSTSSTNRYNNTNRYYPTQTMSSSSSSFLKTYNSSMSSLMTSASKLKANSLWNQKTVQSSDTAVMDVEQKYRLNSNDSYAVHVDQLAAAQTNTSDSLKSSDLATSDAVFSLSTASGTKSFTVKAQDDAGNVKTNEQMLQEMAAAVNAGNMGVKASVSTKDGTSQMTLTAEKTGKGNGFRVEGSFAEQTGLNKVSQEATDAEYTVSKNGHKTQSYTASENTVSLDYGRLYATLKKTGDSTIQVGMDTDQITSAVKEVVKQYNDSLDMLQENADRGYGVQRQLHNMQSLGISDTSLKQIGITKDEDGKLVLDEEKLKDTLHTNPTLSKELLSGSFSLAQSVFEDGRQGLNQSGASLVQNDMVQQMETNYSNPFQMLGLYHRAGAYTMTNLYSVGNFLNMLV